MKKTLLTTIAGSALVLASLTPAFAVPTLYLTDGIDSVTLAQFGAPVIVDNGTLLNVGTSFFGSATPGTVTWGGNIGSWIVNVTTGTSDPITGTPTRPNLDLNSINVSAAASTLTIRWSDDGFGPTIGNALSLIGGTLNGAGGSSLTFNTYADAGNVLFATTTLLTSQTFTPGAFSGTVGGPSLALQLSPYSLTEEIILVHGAGGASSFNASLEVPEGGSTLMLLGAALSGLGVFARFRKARAA